MKESKVGSKNRRSPIPRKKRYISELSDKGDSWQNGLATYLSLQQETGKPIWFECRGWSMFPFFYPGCCLRIRKMEAVPKVGQVVLVQMGAKIAAHRLVGYEEQWKRWLVKGDSLHWVDPSVKGDDLLGVVDRVRKQGKEIAAVPDEALADFSLRMSRIWEKDFFKQLPGFIRHLLYLFPYFGAIASFKVYRFLKPKMVKKTETT